MNIEEYIEKGLKEANAVRVHSNAGRLVLEEVWLAIGGCGELCFRKMRYEPFYTKIFTWSRVPIVKNNGFTWWIYACFDTRKRCSALQ